MVNGGGGYIYISSALQKATAPEDLVVYHGVEFMEVEFYNQLKDYIVGNDKDGYDYSNCAYKIKIDLSREDIIDMLDSMCFIQIEYSNELISKTFLLGKSDYKSLNLNQYKKFSYGLVSTTLMNDGNLQIRKDAQVQYIDQMCMIDGYLKIDDETDFSLKSKHKIYTANHFMLNISDIECGIYDVYIQNQKTTLNGVETHQYIDDKTLFIENNNDGYLQVKI